MKSDPENEIVHCVPEQDTLPSRAFLHQRDVSVDWLKTRVPLRCSRWSVAIELAQTPK